MSILCGTDFSEPAVAALTVAAQLAARMKMQLHLIHSTELDEEALHDPSANTHLSHIRGKLAREAERLSQLGAGVTVHLSSGSPDDAILEKAVEVSARLIVVAALGMRRPGKWQLGSHVDRLAQRAHVPVLVVRDSEPISAWARGARPLRIALGADLSSSSKAAMQWIDQWRAFGACEVVAIHLYWPATHFQRLGLSGARSYIDPDPRVSETLSRELRRHLIAVPDAGVLKLRLEPHLGRIGDRLAAIAYEEQADVVVVGTHDRSALGRLWEGSVSRDALHCARSSVVCIPASTGASTTDFPRLRNVVVATDFSDVGNAAISMAYAIAPHGATVHLVHVAEARVHSRVAPRDVFDAGPVSTESTSESEAARRRLTELIPTNERSADKVSCVHVLESNQYAEAICQAAERLDADVLCLGTHGRGGVARVVLGSVAMAVVAQTTRPVLLAHAPRA